MKLIRIFPDSVLIKTDSEQLGKLKINDLLLVSDDTTSIVCAVNGIVGTDTMEIVDYDAEMIGSIDEYNTLYCGILGSVTGGRFTKAIDVYPSTGVQIEVIDNVFFRDMLGGSPTAGFKLGRYANYDANAFLDGNKFFQRHSCIVGNTGSGKSFTVASILEKLSELDGANVILFDLHGEYSDMSFVRRIGLGPDGYDFPFWFLPFRDIYGALLKVKEETATQQIAALRKAFYAARRSDANEGLPIAFRINELIDLLNAENQQVVATGEIYKTGDRAGMPKTTKGDNYGRLTSVINLLADRANDSRYSFMFRDREQDYLHQFVEDLYGTEDGNIKAVDLSAVPHDMIPVIIAAITKLIYSIHLQQDKQGAVPLCFFCEEAHVYIPSDDAFIGPSQRRILDVFETIAKEGRKFGATLCVVSQRPSELNRTIMSQCANYIIMKLSNDIDKTMMKNTLPESSKALIDSLPLFSPGDCLVVGDSADITLKIKVAAPSEAPNSTAINTWDAWSKASPLQTGHLLDRMFAEWQ